MLATEFALLASETVREYILPFSGTQLVVLGHMSPSPLAQRVFKIPASPSRSPPSALLFRFPHSPPARPTLSSPPFYSLHDKNHKLIH